MSPTAHLTAPLGEYGGTIECESIDLRSNAAWLHPASGEETLVVPTGNIAGVTGETVDRSVEQTPTQGGQYTEVVTRLE